MRITGKTSFIYPFVLQRAIKSEKRTSVREGKKSFLSFASVRLFHNIDEVKWIEDHKNGLPSKEIEKRFAFVKWMNVFSGYFSRYISSHLNSIPIALSSSYYLFNASDHYTKKRTAHTKKPSIQLD
jgi:hypothetical protein